MYELVRGPLVWIALIVFVLGSAYQVLRFFALSRKASRSVCIPSPGPHKVEKKRFSVARVADFFKPAEYTVLAVYPVTITVSTIFHLLLFVVPLVVLGHNELIELSLGVSLPSVAENVADMLTLIVLLCCLFFVLRRVFVPRVRAISTFYDYLVLTLATVPFLSGLLAFHQLFDYRGMMIVHMLSGELMLMAIPFTKLSHMTFFFFNRFLVVNEHTIGKGNRVW